MTTSRILVTGGSGVVGTAVIAALEARDYEVVAPRSAEVDLTDLASAVRYFTAVRPTSVIHLAARVHGLMGHVGHQGSVYLDNILINTHAVEAARIAGARKFVAMGSAAVYSDLVALPMHEGDVWLGPPHRSEIGYAQAKRAMLAQLSVYRDQYEIEFAFAIATNIYGPNDKFDEQRGHVIPTLISKFHRAAESGIPPVVWGTGAATRDFLFSEDAADGLVLMLEQATGLLNLATGSSVAIRDAVETLAAVSGFSGDITWDRSKPDGQAARAYDVSRMQSLGWAPTVSLEVGLATTYAWYSEHYPRVRR